VPGFPKQIDAQQARTIEVDADPHERHNAHIQARMKDTVWQGCTSWYVNANGHHSTNWPGFTWTYRWLTRHGSLSAYHLSPRA
jgi:hypothetical protein